MVWLDRLGGEGVYAWRYECVEVESVGSVCMRRV